MERLQYELLIVLRADIAKGKHQQMISDTNDSEAAINDFSLFRMRAPNGMSHNFSSVVVSRIVDVD